MDQNPPKPNTKVPTPSKDAHPNTQIGPSSATSKNVSGDLFSNQLAQESILGSQTFGKEGSAAAPQPIPKAAARHRLNLWTKAALTGLATLVIAGLLFGIYALYSAQSRREHPSNVNDQFGTTSFDLGNLHPSNQNAATGLVVVNGNVNVHGSVTANSFSGDGADLTNLNASFITHGTLNDARLSPNVALLNANQTFTGNNTFSGSSAFTGSLNLPSTMTIGSLAYSWPGTAPASSSVLLNNGSGSLSWGDFTGLCPTCIINGGNSFGATVIIGSNDNQNLQLRTNGTTRLTFDTAGTATFSGNVVGSGNIGAATFSGDGSALSSLNANNITSGTLNNARLSASVTLAGNAFNGANELVQLDGLGFLPTLNGSNLNSLNASALGSGTVNDARLSANVALLNGSQTYTGSNIFSALQTFNGGIAVNTITPSGTLTIGDITKNLTLQGDGTVVLTSNSGGFATTVGFTGVPTGNVTYQFDRATTPGTYTICTSVGNCAAGGGAVTTLGGTTNKIAKFTGANSIGDSAVTDTGTAISIQPTANGLTTFRVLDTTGGTNVFDVDTTDSRVGVNNAAPTYPLDVTGDINSSTGLRVGGTLVCNNTGCTASGGSGFFIQNGTSIQANANFAFQSAAAGSVGGVIKGAAAQTADLLDLQNSGGTVIAYVDASGNINTAGQYKVSGVQIASSNLSDAANLAKLNGTGPQIFTGNNKFTGNTITFQNAADSISALQIFSNAGGTSVFDADTLTKRIGINNDSPAYALDVNGDINSSSALRVGGTVVCTISGCSATGGSGSYIQNGTSIQASANFAIQSAAAASIGGIIRGAALQSANLQEWQDSTGAILSSITSAGNLSFGTVPASAGAIRLQNATAISWRNATNTGDISISVSSANVTNALNLPGSIVAGGSDSTVGALYFFNSAVVVKRTAASGLQLLTAGTTGIVLNQTGQVGINPATNTFTGGTVEKLRVNTPTTADNLANVIFGTSATTAKGLVIQATAAQSANLTEWQTSTGTQIAAVDASGRFIANTLGTGDNATYLCRNSSNQIAACSASGAGAAFVNGGNSFGGSATLGTNDANTLAILTSGSTRAVFDTSNNVYFGNGITNAAPAGFALNGTGGSGTDIAGAALTLAGGVGTGTGAGGSIIFQTAAAAAGTGSAANALTTRLAIDQNDTTGSIITETATNLTSGNGFLINGPTSGSNLTGSLLNVNTGSTGTTSSGIVLFNFTGAHGGNGLYIADSTQTANVERIDAGSLTSGRGLIINGPSSGATFTGNLLNVNTATTGASSNGFVQFSFTGAHTGVGFQLDDTATQTGIAQAINVGALTSGTGLSIAGPTSGSTLTGTLLNVSNTSTGAASSGFVRFISSGLHTGNGFQVADATNTGTAQSISVTALTSGTGLIINGPTSGSTFTGFLLNATTATTGAATNGFARFNFTGAHTGQGVQIDDATQTGIALGIFPSALTTGTGLRINATSATQTGPSLRVDSTSTAAVVAGAGLVFFNFSGAHTNVGFQINDVTATGTTMAISSSALTSGTSLRINSTGSTQTGSVIYASSNSTGAITNGLVYFQFIGDHTGNGLNIDDATTAGIAQNISVTSLTSGTGLIIRGPTSGSTLTGNLLTVQTATTGAATNGFVRFNFSGAHTGSGFQIDDATTSGNAAVINSNSNTSGLALKVSATGETNVAQFLGSTSTQCTVVTGTGWSCSSDQRLKTNILSINDGLDKILQLRGVTYNWLANPNGTQQDGFIAQEVQKVLPELVSTDPTTGMLSLNKDGIMAYLVNAVQQQQTQIDALKAGQTPSSQATSTDILKTLADAKAVTLNGDLTVNGIVVIKKDLSVSGHVGVGSDTAGTAKVVAGQTKTHVTFATSYSAAPNVTVSPQEFLSSNAQYRITAVSTTGFDIELSVVQAADTNFDWHALATTP